MSRQFDEDEIKIIRDDLRCCCSLQHGTMATTILLILKGIITIEELDDVYNILSDGKG